MNDLSRPQLRLIIFYEWSCGTPAAETVTKIGKVFGETTVTDRTVRNWYVRFRSGEKCFEDNDCCGRPIALNNDLLRDAVKKRQSPNHQQSSLTISGMRTGYSTITTRSMLLYSNQFASLGLALREKRPRRFAVHLLHDNARPHVAKATQAKIQALNWDTVPDPPYSSDIAPSDYHLFRSLKLFLKEKRFAKRENLKTAVFDFFDSQSAAFWKKGIDDFPERWLTVVTNDGQYIVD
uniref:HTH_48 domain-containing protein n=1 Tax=Caenorhabditis japonica TaxID=281687 RepID=A0A8R1DLM7_CAEJA